MPKKAPHVIHAPRQTGKTTAMLASRETTEGIELKVWRNKKGDPLEDGLEQLDSYLARLGVNFGWLIIFDHRAKALPIEERLTTQVTTTNQGRSVIVVRA